MQSNWSLILNVLLLIGVVVAIVRLIKARKASLHSALYQPSSNQHKMSPADYSYNDDIIAVRKVSTEPAFDSTEPAESDEYAYKKTASEPVQAKLMVQEESRSIQPSSLMMFLAAKENRHFAGYELLQTVLACGLRFGEGNLFYRHQHANGQGPVLCGLAAATPTGIFDLQNIGAFSAKGLCLFMHASKNPSMDAERFSIMLETAKQLSEGLNATILDDQRRPLNEEAIARYYKKLNIEQRELEMC